MIHMRLWAAAGIIAVVVLVGFLLSVPIVHEVAQAPGVEAPVPVVPLVSIRDVYKKGTHTITGTVQAANACSAVEANASASGDTIALAITVSGGEGVCLQVPTAISFSTKVAAPAGVPIGVTVNGAAASTTSL